MRKDRKTLQKKILFRTGSFLYFFWCYFSLFTGYAHAYIDPSAVTYMIQAVAALAIAAGAAVTVFRHKIAALFRKGSGHARRRPVHLTEEMEKALRQIPEDEDLYP
ncbi:MAG: hypothetical protein IJ600_01255 [Lachnospiraceae bacterium]|nr:hypothetical protein [Lachnospiraceae bacterium]